MDENILSLELDIVMLGASILEIFDTKEYLRTQLVKLQEKNSGNKKGDFRRIGTLRLFFIWFLIPL